ncbi:MAG: hypothetical protein L0221_11175 [Chloroflexi bacterium]|nr:hypothetical protein [Chloroflexota bacterium]
MQEEIGTLALGVFLGYMAWFFATRVTTNWMTSFSSVVGVLFGGVVLTFLGGAGSDGLTFYPIGLVVGWIIYALLKKFGGPGWPTVND